LDSTRYYITIMLGLLNGHQGALLLFGSGYNNVSCLLLLLQNYPPGTVAYPTKYRIRDGLATAALMGWAGLCGWLKHKLIVVVLQSHRHKGTHGRSFHWQLLVFRTQP
jgi:hypothetical protein